MPGRLRRVLRWFVRGALAFLVLVALLLGGLAVAYPGTARQVARFLFVPVKEEEGQVDAMIESEELILSLTPELKKLNTSLQNLRFPDRDGLTMFGATVTVVDLDATKPREQTKELGTVGLRVYEWPVQGEAKTVPSGELSLWRPLLDDVDYFEYGKVYFIRAEFTNAARDQWKADMGLEALCRTTGGGWRVAKGNLSTLWKKHPPAPAAEGEKASFKIAEFRLLNFKTYEADNLFFREVLDAAVTDPATRKRLRKSIQDELIVKAATDKDYPLPTKYFDKYSFDRHPGVSSVDIDRDGWDDLYMMDQWGKNSLLRNQGNGNFVDIAPELGLDLENFCSSAVFADYDNDGDLDVFIGRNLERSRYLVNENGKFVDASEKLVSVPLPYLVSSVAAADYNNDGLLDVYFSTYASDCIDKDMLWLEEPSKAPGPVDSSGLLLDFLPRPQAERLLTLQRASHPFKARVGPPNVLLVNKGGRFELSPASPTLEVWRNTYQSTWGDYDGDGDQDIYVANDYSANNLFRNNGDGTFTDVTGATKTADIGFGMGASWGDYDNDGKQDLYVSNMFSKAGQRITGKLGGMVDHTFADMARGNSLFSNKGPDFDKVSGMNAPALQVEVAGWSWGGQFLDVDNDGYLDVFAPNGFYSAPKEIAIEIDL